MIYLNGFCDGLEREFAADVYIISCDTSYLSISKTRVAPLKKVTILRLELCDAVLLVQLMHSLVNSLTINVKSVTMWTDSTVELHWIYSDAHKWTTFVSDRVTTIQETLPLADWRHVRSADNPPDLASRGMLGDQLIDSRL